MELEGSSPHLQEPTTCTYPEQINAFHISIPILEDTF